MIAEQKPRLLTQVRNRIRTKGYARSTEGAYVYWIRAYILFHGKRHPVEMGVTEIEEFLSHLAQRRRLSPTTQNQALNAIVFLYREILQIQLPHTINAVRSKRRERVPTVLTRAEVGEVRVTSDLDIGNSTFRRCRCAPRIGVRGTPPTLVMPGVVGPLPRQVGASANGTGRWSDHGVRHRMINVGGLYEGPTRRKRSEG